MKTIADIGVGHTFESPKNGPGMVTKKTARTVTALFENGNEVKITYKHSDAYFWGTDF